MRAASYEIMDDGVFYGEIGPCQGVWASGTTLEACREELGEVLEDWVMLRLQRGHLMPMIEGVDLAVSEVA